MVIKLGDVEKYEGIIDPEKYSVNAKPKKCEICQQSNEKYSCVLCKRRVCASCYIILNGVCKKCSGEKTEIKPRKIVRKSLYAFA